MMVFSLLLVAAIGYFGVQYTQTHDPKQLVYAAICFLVLLMMEILKRSRELPPLAERSGLAARLFAGMAAFRAGEVELAKDSFLQALEQAAKLPAQAGPLVQVVQLYPRVMEGETPEVQAYRLATASNRMSEELHQLTNLDLQHLGMALVLLFGLVEYCEEKGMTGPAEYLKRTYRSLYRQLCNLRGTADPLPEALKLPIV